uniref:CUE domain-containing protein n=1 Tax=Steinernema glaseri TaxID=37863 RepID=A0A1I7ZSJ4_9BILA
MSDSGPGPSSGATLMAGPLPPKKVPLNIVEMKKKVLLGDLPADFLRLTVPQQQGQPAPGQQPAQQHVVATGFDPTTGGLSAMESFYTFVPPHTRGRIAVRITEAKLTKNYGLVRMDPYCRVRVGNAIFETPTSVSGAKTPKWNRIVNAYLPNGVESIYVQIFDERAFTQDECIAWAHVLLPEGIFNGETIDEWYPLSGQQGEGREGLINLVISFAPVDAPVQNPPQLMATVEGTGAQPAPEGPLYTEEEVKELSEMFPNIDAEVIRSVLDEKRGDKDGTVTALLEMAG